MELHSILFLDHPCNESIAQEFTGLCDNGISIDNSKAEVIYTQFNGIDYDSFPNLKYVVCPCTNIDHLSPELATHIEFIHLDDPKKLYASVNSSPEWVINQIFNLLKHNRDPSDELVGKSIGFVGYGRMMQKVAQLMSGYINYGAVEMLYYDKKEPEFFTHSLIRKIKSINTILSHCDIIAIGLTANKETKNVIGYDSFMAMEENRPYFLNNSRSSVVEEGALIRAIENNNLRGVALDVIEDYSTQAQNKLRMWAVSPRNVYVTPHIAGRGAQSREATDRIILESLKEKLNEE